MAKLNEVAKDYVATATTKIVSDLDSVPTDIDLLDDEFEFEKDGVTKTVKQKIIVIDGDQYRVPVSVISQLKVVLEDNPNLKKFKVKRTGTGKDDTRYQVIPLME